MNSYLPISSSPYPLFLHVVILRISTSFLQKLICKQPFYWSGRTPPRSRRTPPRSRRTPPRSRRTPPRSRRTPPRSGEDSSSVTEDACSVTEDASTVREDSSLVREAASTVRKITRRYRRVIFSAPRTDPEGRLGTPSPYCHSSTCSAIIASPPDIYFTVTFTVWLLLAVSVSPETVETVPVMR